MFPLEKNDNGYNNIRVDEMKGGEVLITDDPLFHCEVQSVKPKEWYGPVYCFEMEDESHPYFYVDKGILTHNCRLKNDITDQLKNDFSYTLGGVGVSTGSTAVITINMNRLFQTNESLNEVVARVHKYLVATRKLVEEVKEYGGLPHYDAGFVDISKQYLTVGVNGLVEAAEFLGYDISANNDYLEWLASTLGAIRGLNQKATREWGYKFNTEAVPSENLGVKNLKWDKADGLWVPKRHAYNSYFYRVEDENVSAFEKIKLHGKRVLEYLDGGSALHLNLEEYPDKTQAVKLLDLMAKEGCNYFCMNIKVSRCTNDKCGYIEKRTVNKCPRCGAPVEWATRVIGYLKKIKSFSPERQREEAERFYH